MVMATLPCKCRAARRRATVTICRYVMAMAAPDRQRRPPIANKKPPLSPAAERALAEAAARRAERERRMAENRPKEIDGAAGPDPVRYGDWEIKGIAKDF
jgi:hypothetical protein